MIEGLSAITLATHDMCRAVRFYQALGFELLFGGEAAAFTSFRVGTSYLNLIAQPAERQWSWWGRVIFYVGDVASIGPSGLLRCRREPQFTDQRPRALDSEAPALPGGNGLELRGVAPPCAPP
jgi:catechol 2,3-dioxygenase-like lactoylglutathione lyase family enzyme